MKYCTLCKAKYDDSVSFCPVDGEVLEDDPSSIVGTVLDGQYQIDAMLGKGGMGAVYRARHILLGDRVAIKVLPPEVRNNAEWLRRFRREGQAARRFRHPNSVTVYDLRTAADGTIYMVMEYVEGHTLDAEIRKRGRLTHSEAFHILEPIMSVLNTAHEMGVVHRDLKPENIMIGNASANGEYQVKLLDLGIAKMREIAGGEATGTTALTVAGQVLGTPYYMSPEQWGEIPRDGSSEIDGRADIYSLGLVFYEMIAGKRPYSGKTLQELRREHITVTPPPLSQVVEGVPPVFSEAIARSMAKDRGDRQVTAGQLAGELRASVDSSPQPFRTIADQTPTGSQSAQTAGIAGARETQSDVNAPTILTIESPGPLEVPTHSSETVAERALPKVPAFEATFDERRKAATASTLIETGDLSSSATIQQASAETTELPKSRGKTAIFAGLAVLLLVLIAGGIGGFLAWNKMTANQQTSVKTTTTGTTTTGTTVTSAETPVEMGRYWLELDNASGAAQSNRATGNVALASGQSLKFHFVFSQNGYLYVVGPGANNAPTAFLTAKPPEGSGLTSNQVKQDTDFSFPSGARNWLTLDKNPGTEIYTIVYSPTSLSTPGFFAKQATGEPLMAAEQKELADLVARYQSNKPVTEVNDADPGSASVRVKVPAAASGNPIVFNVRIDHK